MIATRRRVLVVLSVLGCAASVAAAPLTKVVDSFDQVPGAAAGVSFTLPPFAAVHKNGVFVFYAEAAGTKALWRTGPAPGGFTRLVDSNTAIPAGTGFPARRSTNPPTSVAPCHPASSSLPSILIAPAARRTTASGRR